MERTQLGVEARQPAESGFMYIEVLVSLVILGFALLSILPMYVLAARENAAAGDLTFASTMAQDKAEELRGEPFDDLDDGTEDEIVTMRQMRYRRSWTVDEDQPHPGLKMITVSVEPIRDQQFGRSRAATVSFYRAE